MKKLKFPAMALLAIALLVQACKKDSTTPDEPTVPGADGTILSKVDYWTPSSDQSVTIRELVLDANKEIAGLKTFSTAGAGLETYTGIVKNTEGKIVKVTGTRASDGAALSWDFEYGTNGKIAKRTSTQGSSTSVVVYKYDDAKRLLTSENMNNLGTTVTNRTTYVYTGTGLNPTSFKQENFNPATATVTTALTFDDKKNPFQAAHELLYYMGMGEFYINNVTKQTPDSGTAITYEYTYNATGFAISKKGSNGSGLKFQLISK